MSIDLYKNDSCDPSQYLDLMKNSFDKTFNEAWFNWYNRQSPTGPSRIYYGVDSQTQNLVASLAFLPIRVAYKGLPRPGSIYVNAMTHPAYQGRGLNLKLLQSALADARRLGEIFSITFPATSRMSMKGMLKTGWVPTCEIFYSALNRKPSETKSSAQRIESLDGRFDHLLESFSTRLDIGLFKDHRYLNWRLLERPDQEYELYAVFNGVQPTGIMYLKKFQERKVRKIHIVELIGIEKSAIMQLLHLAEREAYISSYDVLNIWLSKNSVHYELLTQFGFVDSLDKNTLLVHWYEEPMRLTSDSHMHFSLADNDVY